VADGAYLASNTPAAVWQDAPPQSMHHTVFRTVFGVLSVESPRSITVRCSGPRDDDVQSLATPASRTDHPELLFLETKWAALVSYGLTSTLLQDVLPLDEPLHAVTIRNHVLTVAERLEKPWRGTVVLYRQLSRRVAALPMPNGPITVGIDGGYVKAGSVSKVEIGLRLLSHWASFS